MRMAAEKNQSQLVCERVSDSEVNQQITKKFLIILSHLNSMIQTEGDSEDNNIQTTRCIALLIECLGTSVDGFFPNIMNLLKRLMICRGQVAVAAHSALFALVKSVILCKYVLPNVTCTLFFSTFFSSFFHNFFFSYKSGLCIQTVWPLMPVILL
jgi:hypothetical protein